MQHLFTAAALLVLSAGGPVPEKAAPAPQDQAAAPSDRAVNPAQPDFTLVGLPTTLRMPRFASAFRVTHRFNRPLGDGDLGDLASDLFGLDAGGQIGLEYRFGIMAGTQIGIHRTSDRTIQFFAQHNVIRQGDNRPVGIDVVAAVEGTNNFRDSYSPSIGAAVSRTIGRHGALYVHPIWVNNTSPDPSELTDDNDTFIVGVGARFRVRPTVYVVGEAVPRFGFEPDAVYASFGIEKRAGGHSFQLNFGTGLGTTFAQMARGGPGNDQWFIGFNISRKFF